MRSATATRVALACSLAFAPAAVLAVADGPDYFTTRNLAKGHSLTLRLGPSPSEPVAGTIPAGTSCIRNLGCNASSDAPPADGKARETWCKVEHAGKTGWAPSGNLAEAACQAKHASGPILVAFKPGLNSATIKGELHGRADASYRVPASAGQKLTVALKASNPQAYFNVSAPGSAPVAMFIGSTGGKFDGVVLPDDGEYVMTVYLMRAAARRNEDASYTLTVKLDGQALKPVPAAQDALVKGTRYHATATIPCTPPYGLKVPCEAGVVRRAGAGNATVDIAVGKDLRRRILFMAGKPAASDATAEMKTERKGDVTVVTIDDESYSIPDPLISGG
jgi:uncharacterized protein YraI